MLKRIDQYHPDSIADSHLGRQLSGRWRRSLKLLGVLLAWYGCLSSLSSILSSLSWVIDAANFLYANAGQLKPVLVMFGVAIHHVVEAWHTWTLPLHHFLFGWLSFKVPHIILDLGIIFSVIGSGYIRSCIASRPYRPLMKVWGGPEGGTLTELGRIVLAKRIAFALSLLNDDSASENLKDKAEAELVTALDEMTEGLDDVNYQIIEEAFSLPTDELQEFFLTCARAQGLRDWVRRHIMLRAVVVASFLAICLAIDQIYKMCNQ